MTAVMRSVRNSALSAAVFSTVVLVFAYAHALVTGLSESDRVSEGGSVSSSAWNKIVNSVLELDGRTANLWTYVADATQTSNVVATTSTWMDIPGATATFTLPSAKTLNLRASGSAVLGTAASVAYGHCGFRFVVDGTPYGDSLWGDRILGCNGSTSSTPTGWWCPWTIERNLPVSAGSHTVKVQIVGWGTGYPSCVSQAESFSAAKLSINSR